MIPLCLLRKTYAAEFCPSQEQQSNNAIGRWQPEQRRERLVRLCDVLFTSFERIFGSFR